MGLHYLSDILVGFIFGLLIGGLVLNLTPLIMAVFSFGFY